MYLTFQIVRSDKSLNKHLTLHLEILWLPNVKQLENNKNLNASELNDIITNVFKSRDFNSNLLQHLNLVGNSQNDRFNAAYILFQRHEFQECPKILEILHLTSLSAEMYTLTLHNRVLAEVEKVLRKNKSFENIDQLLDTSCIAVY